MSEKTPITVAHGDGIGPEIMEATLHILKESTASLDIHEVEIGEKVYLRGHETGIESSTWDTIRATKAFLKAPITTPQGGGFKSLNVTVRTTLGLYANVRPCVSFHPYVKTKHPNMDVVIIRENEEDLYAGIEYRQTQDVFQSLKIISRTGTEKIVRYAFDYAVRNNRKKVTCFTKDNIMKLSDGAFHNVFEEVAKDYPGIENEHWIVDIGAAKLADTPENFDVVVVPNLYGDILSDVAAQIAGSVGLAGSANIGAHGAMFEAIHGSAPRRAGQNLANPSGLILASILMLVHIEQTEAAAAIHNAWLKTVEDGIHTYDIFKEGISSQKVGTQEFAQAVVARLGQKPEKLKEVCYASAPSKPISSSKSLKKSASQKELMGVDIFLQSESEVHSIQEQLQRAANGNLKLTMISNRGVTVWPKLMPETTCVDHWRCRFMSQQDGEKIKQQEIVTLLQSLSNAGVDFIKTEHLYNFDGQPGYSSAQK